MRKVYKHDQPRRISQPKTHRLIKTLTDAGTCPLEQGKAIIRVPIKARKDEHDVVEAR